MFKLKSVSHVFIFALLIFVGSLTFAFDCNAAPVSFTQTFTLNANTSRRSNITVDIDLSSYNLVNGQYYTFDVTYDDFLPSVSNDLVLTYAAVYFRSYAWHLICQTGSLNNISSANPLSIIPSRTIPIVFKYDGSSALLLAFVVSNATSYRVSNASIGANFVFSIDNFRQLSDDDAADYQSGYDAGLLAGQQIGYDNGYAAGNAAGLSTGFDNGYAAGDQAGYDRGYAAGYDAGLSAGSGSGSDDLYQQGYNAGYNVGYTSGYADGDQAGYDRGYDTGYAAGSNYRPTDSNIYHWSNGNNTSTDFSNFWRLNRINYYTALKPDNSSSYFSLVPVNSDLYIDLYSAYNDGYSGILISNVNFNSIPSSPCFVSVGGGNYDYDYYFLSTAGYNYIPFDQIKNLGLFAGGVSSFNYNDIYKLSFDYQFVKNPNGGATSADTKNQTDELTNGYDSGGIDDSNDQLSSSMDDYNAIEDQVNNDSISRIDDINFVSPSSLPDQLFSAISLSSSFLQSLFINFGDFSFLILISLSLSFALMLVGWFRYR